MSADPRTRPDEPGPSALRRLAQWLGRGDPSPKEALLHTIELCRRDGADAVRRQAAALGSPSFEPGDLLRRSANLALELGEIEVAVELAPLALERDGSKAMHRWASLLELRAGLLHRPLARMEAARLRVGPQMPNARELRARLGLARLRDQLPQARPAPVRVDVTAASLYIAVEPTPWAADTLAAAGLPPQSTTLAGWTADGDGAADDPLADPSDYLAAAEGELAARLAKGADGPMALVAVEADLWQGLPAMLAARRAGVAFAIVVGAPLPPPPTHALDERGRFLHNLQMQVLRDADALLAADVSVQASLELAGAPLDRIVVRGEGAPARLRRLLTHRPRPLAAPGTAGLPDVLVDADADAAETQPWIPMALEEGQAVVLRGKVDPAQRVRLRVDADVTGAPRRKALIAAVRYLDGDGREVPAPYPDCAASERHPAYFYVGAGSRGEAAAFGRTMTVPEGARRLELRLSAFDRGSPPRLVRRPRLERRDAEPAVWQPAALEAGRPLKCAALAAPGERLLLSLCLDSAGPGPKAAVAQILFIDRHGKPVLDKVAELASSPRYPQYVYASSAPADSGEWQYHSFVAPPGTARVELRLHLHQSPAGLRVVHRPALRVLRLADLDALRRELAPHPGWLSAAAALAQSEGALTLLESLLADWVRVDGAPAEALRRWSAVRAELEELRPDWMPSLGVRRRLAPTGRLTVCHLHKTAYPFENTGGAIRCLNTLTSQQAAGLDPYVITPPGYPAIDETPVRDVVEGVEHFRIGPATEGVKTLSPTGRTRYAAVQSAAIVARRGASLIHAASGVRGYELALQAFALGEAFDIPVIYEVRSFHEHTWAPADPRIFDLERTQRRVAKENACMAMADHVVTISESMRRILVERGVAPERIDVVPNAIDAEAFRVPPPARRIEALEGADAVVGYVSNMSRREGHVHLLEAVARLRGEGLDVRCLLVGQGPEQPRLERRARTLGIEAVTVFAGEVDHREVQAYYCAIDVFVVPRIPDYAADWVTPLKPYEAMALGRPLVVTDLPALREVVGDGERGRIARPADAESLAGEIGVLVRDPGARRAQAQRARAWVFEHRTWQANARRYAEIYERVLAARAARTGRAAAQDA